MKNRITQNRRMPLLFARPTKCTVGRQMDQRGSFALAAIKGAFNARHGGVGGLSRVTHDMLLRAYLDSDESKELREAFGERRKPDPSSFGH